MLIFAGWNSQVDRGLPGKLDSSNASRRNVSRGTYIYLSLSLSIYIYIYIHTSLSLSISLSHASRLNVSRRIGHMSYHSGRCPMIIIIL